MAYDQTKSEEEIASKVPVNMVTMINVVSVFIIDFSDKEQIS